MKERPTIIAAAVKIGDLIVSVPAPGRHGNIIHPLHVMFGHFVGPDEQGFLTNRGEFVNRFRANSIAKTAGQVSPTKPAGDLFSEDLW